MIHSFDPIAAPDARVLVLGTIPGRRSLEAGEYYAHPQNAFWFIMESLFAARTGMDYAARTALLRGAQVALWDMLQAADRIGSLDSAIAPGSETPNDLAGFFVRHPAIHTIFFNGDPTAWARYEINVVLPKGSPPGTWGLQEMEIYDKARNRKSYSFVETLHFELLSK